MDARKLFEDSPEGINPEIALKSHAMFMAWHDSINDYLPLSLEGDPEQLDAVINGACALVGELLAIVCTLGDRVCATDVWKLKQKLVLRKMDMVVADIAGSEPS